MAKRGEILNRGLLRRLASRLGMGAVTQFPNTLNTDEVIVTAGLFGPYSDYVLLTDNATNSLAGLNAFNGIMAANPALTFPVVPMIDTAEKESRVIAGGCRVVEGAECER